jgi:glycosyltransferase involved in cell wall biosynthesis
MMMNNPNRIALLLSGIKIGGDSTAVINLIKGLASQEIAIDLVLASAERLLLEKLPPTVRVIDLKTPVTTRTASAIHLIPPLVQYLHQEKPIVLISNLILTNAIAVLTKLVAFVPVKLILVEHVALSKNQHRADEPQSYWIEFLMRSLYPFANATVCVSHRMANQLRMDFNLKNLTAIYNAVVDDTLTENAQERLDHPWFQPDQSPVFLSAGRFTTQKDFSTLIRAFSIIRRQMPARLIILGEGSLRGRLEALIQELNLKEDVALPGFELNPYRYMSRATVFVLSSRWEALPTVLIEAMACGCQLVATNCPYGVDEILAGGTYGRLVPLEDPAALAEAMKQAIESPINPALLKSRAADFSVDRATSQYLSLIKNL